MRGKNSKRASVIGKTTMQVAPEVTFVQVLNAGAHVRVWVPSTGRSVHAATGSDAARAALTQVAADGHRSRLVAQADLLRVSAPGVAALIREVLDGLVAQ